jgi:hypothetical protein
LAHFGKEFILVSSGRKYIIIASSPKEAIEWIDAINAVINYSKKVSFISKS